MPFISGQQQVMNNGWGRRGSSPWRVLLSGHDRQGLWSARWMAEEKPSGESAEKSRGRQATLDAYHCRLSHREMLHGQNGVTVPTAFWRFTGSSLQCNLYQGLLLSEFSWAPFPESPLEAITLLPFPNPSDKINRVSGLNVWKWSRIFSVGPGNQHFIMFLKLALKHVKL